MTKLTTPTRRRTTTSHVTKAVSRLSHEDKFNVVMFAIALQIDGDVKAKLIELARQIERELEP